ncbi:MAG: sodium:solute symporter family protein [candidate division KSB1 bacterium]|nr:sodium:solute symporter family protein [candidate division KSB1 bacterium]
MTLGTIDIIGIILYFSVLGIFAYFTRRTKSFSEFSIAKHSVPAAMIFASIAATYVGPGFAVGMTSKGYSAGYAFYFFTFAYVLQTIIVGLFIAPRLTEKFRDCYTLGDVMEKCYGKFAHLLAGIVSVGLCIGFSGIMAKIGGSMLQAITGWDLMLCIVIITFMTGLYTMTGGIRASIATDALQFGLFSIIIPVMLILAFIKMPESADVVMTNAKELTANSFKSFTILQIIAIVISFLLGETLIPPYANRALASKSTIDSKKGFSFAGAFGVIWLAIVITLGIIGHSFVPEGTKPDDVFLVIGSILMPPGAFGLLLASLIAIVMSSQDSVINAGSVSIVRDIIGFRKQPSEKSSLFLGRAGTVLIVVIATVVARYAPSIIDGLLICYSIWAPALLLPLILGLFLKRTVHLAGWLSMLGGGITSILWQTVWNEPEGIPAIIAGLLIGGMTYFIGYMLGSRKTTLSGGAK